MLCTEPPNVVAASGAKVFDAVYQEKGALTKGLLLGMIMNGFAFLFLTLSSFSDPVRIPSNRNEIPTSWLTITLSGNFPTA